MAEEQDGAVSEFPEAPALVSPKSEMVVDARDVTFAWEPVEGAEEYHLEVAADSSFESPVVDERVGTATELTPDVDFAEDGRTYYWRVLARDARGWSHGDRVESFVSSTAEFAREQAAQSSKRPGGREEDSMGPAAELFYASGVEATAEVTGSDALLEEERRMGVAHEGVEAGQIIAIAATVLVAVIIATFIVFFWSGSVSEQARQRVVGLSGYPELRRTDLNAQQLLDQYGVTDREQDLYRIPIERSMRLMIDEAEAQRSSATAAPAGIPEPETLEPEAAEPRAAPGSSALSSDPTPSGGGGR